MRDLPDWITAGVFRSANGEFGWRRSEIEQALRAICDSGQAILGGEVWLIVGRHTWYGLIPDRHGRHPGVWSWDTAGRKPAESWVTYCERTFQESIDSVRQIHVEDETRPELCEQLRFNVTYIDESSA